MKQFVNPMAKGHYCFRTDDIKSFMRRCDELGIRHADYGKWAIAGSTNLDSRSFGINDEVNVAIPDPAVVARLEEDFQRDRSRSREMTHEQWKNRPFWEKLQEWCGWLIQRQE